MKRLLIMALIFGWANASAVGNVGTLPGQVTELKKLEAHHSGRSMSGLVVVTAESEQVSKPAPPPAKPTSHRAQPGETLGKIGKQFGYDWRALCVFNSLPDCNRIMVNQEIRFPAPGTVVAKSPKTKPVEASCIKLGVDPYNRYFAVNLPRTLRGIDELTMLTHEQKEKAKRLVSSGLKPTPTLIQGQIFREMISGAGDKVKHVYGKRVCMPEEGGRPEAMYIYDLGDGIGFTLPISCGNGSSIVMDVSPPPPANVASPATPASAPPPAPPASTPVVDTPAPEQVPLQKEPPAEERVSVCLLDPKMVVGQEHEPERDGNDAHSTFLTAALYCTWRGTWFDDPGTHGIGFGLQGSWWSGRVNKGAGEFRGRLLAAGPGYEWISDKGWNVEGKLLFGRIHEYFNQGEYASSRTINIVGPAASLNLGQRRARGEKFLPETRLFGMLGLPTSVEASHSWQGKPIADTSELSRFGAYLNLGLHQDVYDFERFTLWGRAGYFLETPVSETANLRIGISDPQRVCGVGVGLDFDLKHGGEAKGWGWWCDTVKGTQVIRGEYRLSQMVKETGATFEEDGTLFVPMPSAKPAD